MSSNFLVPPLRNSKISNTYSNGFPNLNLSKNERSNLSASKASLSQNLSPNQNKSIEVGSRRGSHQNQQSITPRSTVMRAETSLGVKSHVSLQSQQKMNFESRHKSVVVENTNQSNYNEINEQSPSERIVTDHTQTKSSFKQAQAKFNLRRMLRLSSNEMDADPRYIEQLLMYNDISHHDYNPCLDTKSQKFILDRLMNIKVKNNIDEYDKRFYVKAPNKKSISQQKQEVKIKDQEKIQFEQQELMSYLQASRMFEKFRQNFLSGIGVQKQLTTKEILSQKIKMKKLLSIYEKKLFPFQDHMRQEEEKSQNNLSKDELIKLDQKSQTRIDALFKKENEDPYHINVGQDHINNKSQFTYSNTKTKNTSRQPLILNSKNIISNSHQITPSKFRGRNNDLLIKEINQQQLRNQDITFFNESSKKEASSQQRTFYKPNSQQKQQLNDSQYLMENSSYIESGLHQQTFQQKKSSYAIIRKNRQIKSFQQANTSDRTRTRAETAWETQNKTNNSQFHSRKQSFDRSFYDTKSSIDSIMRQCDRHNNSTENQKECQGIERQYIDLLINYRVMEINERNEKIIQALNFYKEQDQYNIPGIKSYFKVEKIKPQNFLQINQTYSMNEVIQDQIEDKRLDMDNLIGKQILKKIKNENNEISNYLQLKGIYKPKIWKPQNYSFTRFIQQTLQK